MFGLEDKEPGPNFEFDLEGDLKKDPKKVLELLKGVDGKLQEIKKLLREGTAESKDFDNYGVLLHGYAALERVLTRIKK